MAVTVLGAAVAVLGVTLAHSTARHHGEDSDSRRLARFPQTILWAWERPEDLRFIDPHRIGVAFLAATLRVEGTSVQVSPRLQPLRVPPAAVLIAVARIETAMRDAATISAEQQATLVSHISELTHLPNVRGVQIDFDARRSQRSWYRMVLTDVRRQLPHSISLSMTALASWCLYDDWLADVPVDEAVPMLFRMGPEGRQIRAHLESGGDFHQQLCRRSLGTATDEPLVASLPGRHRYIFHRQPWTETAMREAVGDRQ